MNMSASGVIEDSNFPSQGVALMNNLTCPRCGSSQIKRNGHTHYGKQNYQCLDCNRQFVSDSQLISDPTKELVMKLLLERIPLRGSCRVLRVSLPWLLSFIVELY